MVSQVNHASGLQWLERLMEASAPPASLPPSRFHCRLANQPDHLVPQHYLETGLRTESPDVPVGVNPEACFTRDNELPPVLKGDAGLLDNFALQGHIAWVTAPGSRAPQPFWLEPEWAEVLSRTQLGDPAPAALSPRARRILTMANVLAADNSSSKHRENWVTATSQLARQFKEKGYAPVGQLIHPFHIAALRRYYRCLIRTGKLPLGDVQSSRRYVAHNETVARFFHHQLVDSVSAIVEEPVKPSYVYLASYQGGAKLAKHTDREQCEFSITLCLDYSPEPRRQTRWPIHLHPPGSQVTVFQAIGDGLLYRGRELPHSRDPLPLEDTSTSIFFHYVRETFSGVLD
jgi:hypothetical protein